MAATGLGKVDSFGEQKPVPIASVAKAMTAYLVLKSHPLKRGEDGPGIKIDAKAEADGKLNTEGESTLDTVHEGDTLTERDALAALMIPSANNIARLLARWEAGSEKAFVAKMNATADELGMKNTTYTDPSGLTASTVSTAEDLVKLGEKLVEFPALMDITKLPEWEDPSGKKWRNYNTLVPFDGALGIKTGSTTKAGGNLLFAAHKMIDGTDQLIVGAVLGQYDDVSIIDEVNAVSKKVMLATLDLLEGSRIVKKGDVVGEVDDGLGHTTPVVATKDVKAVGWSGLTVKLELTDDGKTIPHEAAAGTHVGTLTVGEGASQVKVAVALSSDLEKPSAGSKLTRLG
nr:serine hydrolase [Streptomyces sp. SID4913]